MEGIETYNHSKDVCPRRDASKQYLNKMHGRDAHTLTRQGFLKIFENTRSHSTPLQHANGPPTQAPLAAVAYRKEHTPKHKLLPSQWPP